MKIKLFRSLGSGLVKQLHLDGELADYTEGKTVDVPEAAADALVDGKLAERVGSKITAPVKAPEITGSK